MQSLACEYAPIRCEQNSTPIPTVMTRLTRLIAFKLIPKTLMTPNMLMSMRRMHKMLRIAEVMLNPDMTKIIRNMVPGRIMYKTVFRSIFNKIF